MFLSYKHFVFSQSDGKLHAEGFSPHPSSWMTPQKRKELEKSQDEEVEEALRQAAKVSKEVTYGPGQMQPHETHKPDRPPLPKTRIQRNGKFCQSRWATPRGWHNKMEKMEKSNLLLVEPPVKENNEAKFIVQGSSNERQTPKEYTVIIGLNSSCECPEFTRRTKSMKENCKHIIFSMCQCGCEKTDPALYQWALLQVTMQTDVQSALLVQLLYF